MDAPTSLPGEDLKARLAAAESRAATAQAETNAAVGRAQKRYTEKVHANRHAERLAQQLAREQFTHKDSHIKATRYIESLQATISHLETIRAPQTDAHPVPTPDSQMPVISALSAQKAHQDEIGQLKTEFAQAQATKHTTINELKITIEKLETQLANSQQLRHDQPSREDELKDHKQNITQELMKRFQAQWAQKVKEASVAAQQRELLYKAEVDKRGAQILQLQNSLKSLESQARKAIGEKDTQIQWLKAHMQKQATPAVNAQNSLAGTQQASKLQPDMQNKRRKLDSGGTYGITTPDRQQQHNAPEALRNRKVPHSSLSSGPVVAPTSFGNPPVNLARARNQTSVTPDLAMEAKLRRPSQSPSVSASYPGLKHLDAHCSPLAPSQKMQSATPQAQQPLQQWQHSPGHQSLAQNQTMLMQSRMNSRSQLPPDPKQMSQHNHLQASSVGMNVGHAGMRDELPVPNMHPAQQPYLPSSQRLAAPFTGFSFSESHRTASTQSLQQAQTQTCDGLVFSSPYPNAIPQLRSTEVGQGMMADEQTDVPTPGAAMDALGEDKSYSADLRELGSSNFHQGDHDSAVIGEGPQSHSSVMPQPQGRVPEELIDPSLLYSPTLGLETEVYTSQAPQQSAAPVREVAGVDSDQPAQTISTNAQSQQQSPATKLPKATAHSKRSRAKPAQDEPRPIACVHCVKHWWEDSCEGQPCTNCRDHGVDCYRPRCHNYTADTCDAKCKGVHHNDQRYYDDTYLLPIDANLKKQMKRLGKKADAEVAPSVKRKMADLDTQA